MALYQHAFIVLGDVQQYQPPTRGTVPQHCFGKRWHVWRWRSASDDPNQEPPAGMWCSCQRTQYQREVAA